MLEALKEKVYRANMELTANGLVLFTWGNVSAADRARGVFVIKPSGVSYKSMRPADMAVVDFDGKTVEGDLNPSSDTPTHAELYRAFAKVGGVVHTHSAYATAWAQAGRGIPAYGTTHADYFYGEIPCTRALNRAEIETDYEKNTGLVIAERFQTLPYEAVPGVIVKYHGPFAWGTDAANAVYNATVLENVAKLALFTEQINAKAQPAEQCLLNKHYYRKHGKNAYYGQTEK